MQKSIDDASTVHLRFAFDWSEEANPLLAKGRSEMDGLVFDLSKPGPASITAKSSCICIRSGAINQFISRMM